MSRTLLKLALAMDQLIATGLLNAADVDRSLAEAGEDPMTDDEWDEFYDGEWKGEL